MIQGWRWLCVCSLSACVLGEPAASEAPVELDSAEQAIVYGEDDRRDLYEVDDVVLRGLARSSMVALIDAGRVHRADSGAVRIAPTTLRQAYGLCRGERFETQPVAATCSGVLIDRDLLLTAGHCVEDEDQCKGYAFVFDYAYRAEGQLETISASDVYGCRRLIARRFEDRGVDYAVVQLDRLASGRSPVELSSVPLETDEPLSVLGFTSGLPLKIDTGSRVRSARARPFDYFALDADTFEGSSGSGIFTAEGLLAGVLVRGGEDYVETDAGCRVPREVPADAGTPEWGWEQATYAGRAVTDLCEQGYPSQTLCGIAPSCGDGYCSFDSVDDGCTEDCARGACSGAGCTKSAGQGSVPGEPVPVAQGAAEGCSVGLRVGQGPGLWSVWSVVSVLGLALCRRRGARRRLR